MISPVKEADQSNCKGYFSQNAIYAPSRMSACLNEVLPSPSELGEALRTGVYLAKLAAFFAPGHVQAHKIFDADFSVYLSRGPHFRHTDNINMFLAACRHVGLPEARREMSEIIK